MTKRRALRGYRGRTETSPAKLSACATCHYPRALRTATGQCGAVGTSRPTAIPHAMPNANSRGHIRTRGAHAHYARPRGDAARWGHRALPPYRTPCQTRIRAAIFARAVRTRITVPLGNRLRQRHIRTRSAHAHYPCGAMLARGGSPPCRTPCRSKIRTRGAHT